MSKTHPRFAADFSVNGRPALRLAFSGSPSLQTITVPVDMADVGFDGVVEIAIHVNSPGRPSTNDKRELGFYIARVKVQ